MSVPLHALDTVKPALLRQRRTALTPAWGCVCFAVEVLALDLEVLDRQMRSGGDRLHAIIDDLPDLIAGRGVDDGRVLPIDTSESVRRRSGYRRTTRPPPGDGRKRH